MTFFLGIAGSKHKELFNIAHQVWQGIIGYKNTNETIQPADLLVDLIAL